MKIALLGGGNCHALSFARRWSGLGIECFGIGRFPPKPPALWIAPAGYRYYVAHLSSQLDVALGILDSEQPDVIVNIAAQGESAASFGEYAWMFYQTNCVMLVRLVSVLRQRSWLRRFVQISTSELYGSVDRPAAEDEPIRAASPYAISKAAFDLHLDSMFRVDGFPAQIVRPSNAYCPGQQLHRVIPRAVISAVYGQKLKLQGGGLALKSYVHSEDLADAVLAVIDRGSAGETYNVGPEEPIRIRDLVETISRRSGVGFADLVDEVPAREGEDFRYWLDSSKVRALGWKQRIPLDEGIDGMLAWAKSYPELSGMEHAFKIKQ